jgi:heme/copper-type cytochrome/quinol oxidase subunit 1
MQKVENSLILPVLFLYVWSLTVSESLDFHLHDTYFVVAGFSAMRMLASFFLILFGLYKTIRHRHDVINLFIAVPHILLTSILIGCLLAPLEGERNYIDYNSWNSVPWDAIGLLTFLLIQVIFVIYFIIEVVKKPAPASYRPPGSR